MREMSQSTGFSWFWQSRTIGHKTKAFKGKCNTHITTQLPTSNIIISTAPRSILNNKTLESDFVL